MPRILLRSEHSELSSLCEILDSCGDWKRVNTPDEVDTFPRRLYMDMTLDFFRPGFTPSFFFEHCARWMSWMETARKTGSKVILFRNYPFRSSRPSFAVYERQLEHFTSLAREFYQAKAVYLPHVVSRHAFSHLSTPPGQLINAVRLEKAISLPFSGQSRFFIAYDRDILEALEQPEERFDADCAAQGIEISLAELHRRSQEVAGHAPAQFDASVHYSGLYPEGAIVALPEAQYDVEDMIVDMISNLF